MCHPGACTEGEVPPPGSARRGILRVQHALWPLRQLRGRKDGRPATQAGKVGQQQLAGKASGKAGSNTA